MDTGTRAGWIYSLVKGEILDAKPPCWSHVYTKHVKIKTEQVNNIVHFS